jgi:hypothetical protein
MGRALAASSDENDRALWRDWHRFTRELAVGSAFADNEQERSMARSFIVRTLEAEDQSADVFASPATCASALGSLVPSPEHMFWFEYNFLFVLAAGGHSEKSALGDHTPAGYRQRARFYAISAEAKLLYAKNVAEYLCFLAETTGQSTTEVCASAKQRLARFESYQALLDDIAPA